MKLMPGWHRQIHKLWTSRIAIFGAAVGIASEILPELQDAIPRKAYIAIFLAILIMRFVAQPDAHEGGK